MKVFALITTTLLALMGCRAATPENVFAGSDKVWALRTLNGAAFPATATLSIPKAGEVIGQAPCNRYFGALRGTYPAFDAGPIGSTKMACPDLSAEIAYLGALDAATTADLKDGNLVLSNANGLEMVFTASD